MLLTTHDISPGILDCRLDLNSLYADPREREKFEARWVDFYAADETHPSVFSRIESDTLTYLSESLIPSKTDHRPPLLSLVGNPASHSISSGMCFAFEGNHHEHRFWIGLRKAHLLSFHEPAGSEMLAPEEHNRRRKQQFFDLDYASPFRIGITVFYTLPSPASQTSWSGVSGIRKLFGKEALDRIAEAEQQRIAQIVTSFIPHSGGMMVFQRDAYEAVHNTSDPHYSLALAKAGELYSTYRHNPNVHVVGVAPTRNMLTSKVCDSLVRYTEHLLALCRIGLRSISK
jgi:hypothetical protein